nr:hypothetical protein [Actinopolyspora alba]
MAAVMRSGVEAGRLAVQAGRIPRRYWAEASSPGRPMGRDPRRVLRIPPLPHHDWLRASR